MYQSKLLQQFPFLRHGFSTREEGNQIFFSGVDQEVILNRRNFFAKIDSRLRLDDGVLMECRGYLPGEEVVIVGNDDRGRGMEDANPIAVQALITKEKNIFLFLCTADCLPIILFDPDARVISLIHGSWVTTKKKLVSKVVDSLVKNFQANPKRMVAVIGPGIHKESYRWPKAEQESDPEWQPYLAHFSDGTTGVDLPGFTLHIMEEAGIPKENIDVSSHDTASSDEFFSFYRESRRGMTLDGEIATAVGITALSRISLEV